MNISLNRELEEFVEKEVRTGAYPSPSEVIRAGLRLLKAEKQPKPRFIVASSAELEDKLLLGVQQLDRGEGIRGEVAAGELRERAAARRRHHGESNRSSQRTAKAGGSQIPSFAFSLHRYVGDGNDENVELTESLLCAIFLPANRLTLHGGIRGARG